MDEKGKYKPASPRNSIIYHFNEGCLDLVYNVVLKLRNQMRQSQQTSSTFVNNMSNDDSILADIPSAPKRRRHEHAKRLTMDDLMANIRILDPQFSADNMAQHLSKYETFKFAMIENGKLFWRHSSSNLDIFSLNDVNQSTGVFQEDCYVHLTRSKIDGGHSELSCTCSIYSTLIQLANLRITEEELDGMDISAVQCCHMRLFNDMIQSNLPSILNNTSNSENLLIKDLESSKHLINESICQLPTPSNRSLKFSVYSDHDDSCNFVHITDNKVCCQSGYCDALFSSSKRYVVNLRKAERLCPHLDLMKSHSDQWLDLLPETVASVEVDESEDEETDDLPPPPPKGTLAELKVNTTSMLSILSGLSYCY